MNLAGVNTWSIAEYGAADYTERMVDLKRSPEELLMLAALEDAVNLVLFPKFTAEGALTRDVREAIEWIEEGIVGVGPFTFDMICEAFNLSPSHIRKGLTGAIKTAQKSRPVRRCVWTKNQVTIRREDYEARREKRRRSAKRQ